MTTVAFSHERAPLEAHGSDSEPRSDFVSRLAGGWKHPKRVAAALAAISIFSLAAGVGGLLLTAKQGLSLAHPLNQNIPKLPHAAHAPHPSDAMGFLEPLPVGFPEPLPHPSQDGPPVESALDDSAAATEKGRQAVARLVENLHFCRDEWKTAPRRLRESGSSVLVGHNQRCLRAMRLVATVATVLFTICAGYYSFSFTKHFLVPKLLIGVFLVGALWGRLFFVIADDRWFNKKPLTNIEDFGQDV
eukprot:GHVT01025207.1.p1 GENE.GHVT01025207.1~~GHVT01025207.1.p1  ORF type:complete len:246 (+),score=36.58 GHVT01025207.1:80-817(+)